MDLTTHARPLKMVHEETENARVDINFSDRLSDSTKPLFIVKDRITKIFNRLWQANLDDKGSGFQDTELSFLFGGYCPQYQEVQVWHIRQDEQLRGFAASDVRSR